MTEKKYALPVMQISRFGDDDSGFLLFVNHFLSVVRQFFFVIFRIWTRDQNLACNCRVTSPPPRHLHQRP